MKTIGVLSIMLFSFFSHAEEDFSPLNWKRGGMVWSCSSAVFSRGNYNGKEDYAFTQFEFWEKYEGDGVFRLFGFLKTTPLDENKQPCQPSLVWANCAPKTEIMALTVTQERRNGKLVYVYKSESGTEVTRPVDEVESFISILNGDQELQCVHPDIG